MSHYPPRQQVASSLAMRLVDAQTYGTADNDELLMQMAKRLVKWLDVNGIAVAIPLGTMVLIGSPANRLENEGEV